MLSNTPRQKDGPARPAMVMHGVASIALTTQETVAKLGFGQLPETQGATRAV